MVAPTYTVRLNAFEGPLDLLLHLVRTNELDIYNLPIAQITDQYLAYLGMFEELNLDVAGEYLVMAASLMYMKSRLLLPRDDEDEEEQDEEVADLVRQLAEYQRYREVAEELRDRLLLDRDVFRRAPTPPEPSADDQPAPLRRLELADLFEALRRVLAKAAARRPHTISAEQYSVSDAVRTMVARLRESGRLEFHDLFVHEAPRGLIIATFLGVLELAKLGVLVAEQEGRFGPIYVTLVGDDIDETIADLTEMYGPASAAMQGLIAAGNGEDEQPPSEQMT
ncbi:MAG TPA: segregation/condensation protein A [Candidatus Limnocylindrales bacterium]|nr:segregation/condensation protein A [Candidatus Limnocylindrales bacterium]